VGKFAGTHCMGTKALTRVIEAGVNIIDHGIYLNDELAQAMVKRNVTYAPTISAYCKQTMHPRFSAARTGATSTRRWSIRTTRPSKRR